MKKYIYVLLFLIITLSGVFLSCPTIDYKKISYDTTANAKGVSLEVENSGEKIDYMSFVTVQLYLNYDYHFKINGQKNFASNKKEQFDKESRHEAERYFKGNNESIQTKFKFENYIDLYICMYAPIIEVSYDLEYYNINKIDILANFSKNPYVESINVIEYKEAYKPCLVGSSFYSGYYDIYQDRSKTGEGVVVGILESGIVNDDHANLQNTSVEVRSSIYNIVASTSHATKMALIIAGDNGIAPDATIKSAYLNGSMSEEMEWLINKGVDIINMSFTHNDIDGVYDSHAAYVDYIAYTYNVILVVAAGNEGEGTGYIGTPGLGYNVITVGSISSDGDRDSFSSYEVVDGPVKPTICARGDTVEIFDNAETVISGTSASTAVCTGIISLLLEDYPSLTNNRQRLMALMCANADVYSYFSAYYDNGFTRSLGAGRIDYGNMYDNYSNSRMYLNNSKNNGDTFEHQSLFLKRGETIRVCAASFAKSTGSVSSLEFTDYDIFLLNPNGEVIEGANSIDSVIEIFTYTVTQTGTYQYYVRQSSDRVSTSEYVGVAHRVFTI